MSQTLTIILANFLFIVGSIIFLWAVWRWIQRHDHKK